MRKNTNYEISNCAIILWVHMLNADEIVSFCSTCTYIVIHLAEMICISGFLVLLLFYRIKLNLETYNEQSMHASTYIHMYNVHTYIMIISGNRKKGKTTEVFTSVLSTKCLHYVNKQKYNSIQCMHIHM